MKKYFSQLNNMSFQKSLTYFAIHQKRVKQNRKSSQLKKVAKKKEAVNLIAAELKAPLSKASTVRIKLTFQNYRLENNSLKENNVELEKEISHHRSQFPKI